MGDSQEPDRVRVVPNFDDEASAQIVVGALEIPLFSSRGDPKWYESKAGIDVYASGGDAGSLGAQVKVYSTIAGAKIEHRNLRGHLLTTGMPSRVCRIRDVVSDCLEIAVLGNAQSLAPFVAAGTQPSSISFQVAGVGVEPIPFTNPDTRWVNGNTAPPANTLASAGTAVFFDALLYRLKVSIATFPAASAVRWLQVFDVPPAAPGPPPAGTACLQEWAFASTTTSALQRQFFPEQSLDFRAAPLVFNQSLVWAWSSTPFLFTAALDVTCRLDAEVY